MMKRYVFIAFGAFAVVFLGVFLYYHRTQNTRPTDQPTPIPKKVIRTDPMADPNLVSIEGYVTSNISNLSPVKEAQGEVFQVTTITAQNGTGTVSYTDGKSSYTADFKYSIDPDYKNWIVTYFVVR